VDEEGKQKHPAGGVCMITIEDEMQAAYMRADWLLYYALAVDSHSTSDIERAYSLCNGDSGLMAACSFLVQRAGDESLVEVLTALRAERKGQVGKR
jgi:hypothetical protein